MTIRHREEFSEEYIEACFYSWYRAGEPSMATNSGETSEGRLYISKHIPPDANGRKPHYLTVLDWMDKFDWRARAEALNAQVSIKLDKEVIQERVKTLRKLAEGGETLLEAGLNFLKNTPNPFSDNPSAAVRAIVSASEMIFKYSGSAAKLEAINAMSDRQLEREIRALLGTEPINEDENIVDTTLEDIPDQDADESDNT